MPITITIDGDLAELLERFRERREACRAAGARLEAEDNPTTFGDFNAALRAHEESAMWLALAIDNRTRDEEG